MNGTVDSVAPEGGRVLPRQQTREGYFLSLNKSPPSSDASPLSE